MAKKKGQRDDGADQKHQCHQRHRRSLAARRSRALCCPCRGVSFVAKGIGRCLFVSCYPVIQCFGLDESRHRHHHHRHFY